MKVIVIYEMDADINTKARLQFWHTFAEQLRHMAARTVNQAQAHRVTLLPLPRRAAAPATALPTFARRDPPLYIIVLVKNTSSYAIAKQRFDILVEFSKRGSSNWFR